MFEEDREKGQDSHYLLYFAIQNLEQAAEAAKKENKLFTK